MLLAETASSLTDPYLARYSEEVIITPAPKPKSVTKWMALCSSGACYSYFSEKEARESSLNVVGVKEVTITEGEGM